MRAAAPLLVLALIACARSPETGASADELVGPLATPSVELAVDENGELALPTEALPPRYLPGGDAVVLDQRADGTALVGVPEDALADSDPDAFVRRRAFEYLHTVSTGLAAQRVHRGPRALVRYEDLRRDALGGMRDLCAELEIEAAGDDLARIVDARGWDAIPDSEKGPGRFHRKGIVGSWKEDLSPEQAEAVVEIAGSIIDEFYG